MNWPLLISLLTTAGVAILGWYIVHALNARRDRNNKRREVRVQYLIEAYRRLEAGVGRGSIDSSREFARGFESAIADIQLFGTDDQVQIAKNMATTISTRREGASVEPLLLSLRDALRAELGLGKIKGNPFHFRFNSEGQPSGASNGSQPPMRLDLSLSQSAGSRR